MEKLYLGVCGEIGSGKDTIGNYLKIYKNATVLVSSELLGNILKILHCNYEDRNLLQKLPLGLRESLGETVITNAMITDMLSARKKIVVWNGIRFPSDSTGVKNLPNSFIVGIDVKPETRFNRIRERKQKSGEGDMTWEEFLEISNRPTEQSIRKIISEADFVIDNNGTEEKFREQIDDLITTLNPH